MFFFCFCGQSEERLGSLDKRYSILLLYDNYFSRFLTIQI